MLYSELPTPLFALGECEDKRGKDEEAKVRRVGGGDGGIDKEISSEEGKNVSLQQVFYA